MCKNLGRVYWITGLSGAGKTTIAQKLHEVLESKKHKVVFLDGDMLREVYGSTKVFTSEDRLQVSLRHSRLSKLLTDQGFDVVCATISLFNEVHDWNRANIKNYSEIYLKVSIDVLKERDSKQMYSRVKNGEIENVVGVDVDFDEPKDPDLVIENDGSELPKDIAKRIYEHFH